MKRLLTVLFALVIAASFQVDAPTLADNPASGGMPSTKAGDANSDKGGPKATPYEVYKAIGDGTLRGPVTLQDDVKYFAGIQTKPWVEYSGFRVAVRGGDVATEPGKSVYLTPHLYLHFVQDYIAIVADDEGVPGVLRLKTFQETVGWEDEGVNLSKQEWYEFEATIDQVPGFPPAYELSYRWLPPDQPPSDFISLRSSQIDDRRGGVQFFLEHTVPEGQKATEHGKSNWGKMQLRDMQDNWIWWIALGDTDTLGNWPPLREKHSEGVQSWAMDTWSTYLYAETSVTQDLENPGDRRSVVQAPVNVDRVKDFTGQTSDVPGGIRFYQAEATYPTDGINIQEVRGTPKFPDPHPIIDNNAGNTTFLEWATDPKPQPAVAVAKLVPRLVGCAETQYNLTVDFLRLMADETEEEIEDVPVVKVYQRGDADKNGSITSADPQLIADYLALLKQLSDLDAVNSAGPHHNDSLDKITIVDALYIAQYLDGQRDCWYNPIGGLAGVPGGTATVQVGSAQLAAGAKTVVPITVKDVTSAYGLGAYDLRLTFDPEVVQVDAVQPGDGSFASPAAFNSDNSSGVLLLNGYQPAIQGPTGDATIAQLALTATGGSGSSTALDISVLTLVDGLGNDIAVVEVDGLTTTQ
ncbi:MAG: hypothetical protein HY669_02340 [Chloroflexi bacterium]|nr:hypothetical protein [Chloroflexota bacterium]